MEKSSLEAFNEWIATLPPKQKNNISLFAAAYLPGCDIPLEPTDTCHERFAQWISRYTQDPTRSIGIALALRPIVNFTVMRSITGKGQWQEQRDNVEKLISAIKRDRPDDFESVKKFEDRLRGLQFSEAQDLKMKEEWELLCKNYLTEDAVSSR